MTDPLHDAPRRWDSWAQWAVVILVLLAAFWNFSGQFSAMRQELSDMKEQNATTIQRLERLENRYPFPAPQRLQ